MTERGFPCPSFFYHSLLCQCVSLVCAGGTHCYICILMTPPVAPEAGPSALPRDQLGPGPASAVPHYKSLPTFSLTVASLFLPHVSFICTSTFSHLLHVYHSLHTCRHKHTHLLFTQTNPPSNTVETNTIHTIHTKSTFTHAHNCCHSLYEPLWCSGEVKDE